MSGPLQGITVTDLTSVLAGPFGSMLLSDLGAEVIKVEPFRGDDGRNLGPPFQKTESHLFLGVNRNKKSLVVDLKKAEGREIVLKLVARSDVFMENSRPGTMEKLRLDYKALSAINPRLIYSSTTGFGTEGPHKQKAAYELVLQGYSSVMDRGQEPPQRDKTSVVDVPSGMLMALGVVAALYSRGQTGRGQRVDTSLLGSVLAMQTHHLVKGEDNTQPVFDVMSGRYPSYRTYKTKDGYINIAVLSEGLFAKLCQALNVPHLASAPEFNSHAKRHENSGKLVPIFQEILLKKTSREWLHIMDEAGVPCGPVNAPTDLFHDEHILANEYFVSHEHPISGVVQTVGLPIKMESTPLSVRSAAPYLGQHTEQILDWLGYDRRQIESLKENNVILSAPLTQPTPPREQKP